MTFCQAYCLESDPQRIEAIPCQKGHRQPQHRPQPSKSGRRAPITSSSGNCELGIGEPANDPRAQAMVPAVKAADTGGR